MNWRLLWAGVVAFLVVFNLGYVFHEIVAADFFRESFGPGVQRPHYVIPVIALAFALYIALMASAYPVAHEYFAVRRSYSSLVTGVILGAFMGFLWDFLQGGLIEYATYNVGLSAMLLDSTYHWLEGMLAGAIIGGLYRPRASFVRATG
ncbi:MAG TPA: hypothetical protein VHM70_30925 [Polyangiaceae bacterium]|jgi:hypothetical protein|nr:hypothetical protein [Polyangiaceae bacterium]